MGKPYLVSSVWASESSDEDLLGLGFADIKEMRRRKKKKTRRDKEEEEDRDLAMVFLYRIFKIGRAHV